MSVMSVPVSLSVCVYACVGCVEVSTFTTSVCV